MPSPKRRKAVGRACVGEIMGLRKRCRRAFATVGSVSLLAVALTLSGGGDAQAQASDAQIKALQDQINQLQRAINELKANQAQSAAQAKAAQDQAKAAEEKAAAAAAQASQAQTVVSATVPPRPAVTALGTPYPAEGTPPGIRFNVAGQEFQLYGKAHLSAIAYNQGNKGGWEIESNQSYLGFRTAREISSSLSFIAQIEGEFSMANSPTLKDTFGYRDTFVGF